MRNPYIGPRAFLPGETLYGRDEEVRELFYLVAAERIVLLHSPSGAGKTSLIQAALVPRLISEDFSVLPMIRVGIEPPVDAPVANRYLISTLLSLDEALPEAEQRPLAELVALGLDAYLASRPGAAAPTGSEVLIFDQFEEILTSSSTDYEAKAQFFMQLGVALRDRRRWALFAMRDEYVAALEPLVRPIPTRLSNTFRLELLGVQAAMRAIQLPARDVGVIFQSAAAQRLVDDLRRVAVQRSDGSTEVVLGQAIEPVQLQVVCLRLWAHLPTGSVEIDPSIIEIQPAGGAPHVAENSVSPVDRALMDYYAERVSEIATACNLRERTIRDWCEAQLITVDGLRGQVIQQQGSSAGLANAAIDLLIGAHLVRAEKRRGATWYELAHDRLIVPVRVDNRAWCECHLSLLQRQALLWSQQGRLESLLLSGETLTAQEQIVAQNAEVLTELDAAFLDCCQAARAAAERVAQELAAERAHAAKERRLLWRITVLAIIALLAMLASVALMIYANQQAEQARVARDNEATRAAEAQTARVAAVSSASQAQTEEANAQSAERLARARELAAYSKDAPDQQALILAAAAAHVRLDADEQAPLAATQALINVLSQAGGRGLRIADAHITASTFSPDGQRLALGTDTGEVRIYNPRAASLATPLVNWSAISSASVRSLVFSPDGQTLVAGMGNAMVLVYQVDDASALPQIIYLKEDSGQIWVAYGGGGKRLVFIGASGIWLARSTAPQEVELLGEPTFHTTYAISPDGRWLVVGYQDGRVVRWDLATTSAGSAVQLLGLGEPTFALAFSPDGRWLIGGGADRQVRRWDLTAADPAATVHILGEHTERVNSLAVSPDGQSVASASDDTTVHLWSIDQPGIEEQDLSSPTKAALAVVAFSPDGRWLASAGNDRLVRLWDLTAHSPVVQELHGSEDQIHRLSFSASGDLLVSQSTGGMLRVWSLAQPGPALPLQRRVQACVAHTANATALGLSPDAHTLAVGTDAGGMLLDVNAADLAASARCIPGTDMIVDFAFSNGGRWLIVRSYTGEQGIQARVFDLQSQTLAPVSTFNGIDRLAVSVDRAWLALITRDKTIQLYDLRADTLDKPVWTTSPLAGQINDVKVASGGRWVALATADGTQLWNLQTSGEKPYLLPPGSAGIPPNIVAFSPDARWLVIGESKSLRVWDLNASMTDMPMLQDVGVAISDLVFSPDGHYLISIQNDGRIGVRRMEADGPAKTARLLSETTDSVNPLVFSTDSSHLLSVDRVWDLTTSAAPLVLHKTDQSVNATFSADGNKVVAYVGQGTVLFWELRPAELAAMACRTAGRGLTQDERKTYAFDQDDQSDPCAQTP